MRDIRLYLKDILEALRAVEKFVEGMEFNEFQADDKTSSAVIRKFEVIGEAAKNIPEAIQEKYPGVPWKEMAGFRDKLIHFYFGIKYDLVWKSVKSRVPELIIIIQKMLNEI
jgi:uncharacterized protein with HEPN domain